MKEGEHGGNWGGEITMTQFLQRLRIVMRTLDFILSELGASGPFELKKDGTTYILEQVTDCCMENRLAGRNTRSLFCKSIIHVARGRANVRRQKNRWVLEVKDLSKSSRQD